MSKQRGSSGQRQLRVGEELRHALAHIMERGEVHDPGLSDIPVSVTEVKVSPDLRQAIVFVMPLGGRDEQEVIEALGRARGFLRRRIAQSVQLKFVPNLVFRIDRSFSEADRIERALRRPEVARDLHPDDASAEDPEQGRDRSE